MTQDLKSLIEQRAALDAEIQRMQQEARAEAIAKVRDLMASYGLTMADISGQRQAKRSGSLGASAKVAPKYRNAATGETWSGRGLQPKWMKEAISKGAKLEDFTI